MLRNNQDGLAPDRLRRLLDVAGRQFAAHGPRGASLNQILAEAGVPKGVAYYYFSDKHDLLAAVLEDAWSHLAPMVPDDHVTLDWRVFQDLHRAHLALLRQRPWLAALARHPAPPEVAARLAPQFARIIGLWPRAQAAGLVRTDLPESLVLSMIQGLDAAIDTWWAEHPEATDADADRAFDTLRQLVEPR